MVLDGGILAEMDTPDHLLAKPEDEGVFRSLWERHQRSHGGGGGSKDNLLALAEGEEAKLQGNNSSNRI